MTKIYVAAPWKHKETAKLAANHLIAQGYNVVSRWLWQHDDTTDPAKLREEAIHDMEDVEACDIFVILNLCPSQGKATELGMAYILEKPIFLVGPRSGNIFYHLPAIMQVEHYTDL